VIEHEVHHPCVAETAGLCDLANVYWILAGTSDPHRDRIIPWQYHLWRIADLYHTDLPDYLPRLDPYSVKPFDFDAMLGTQKGPRPLVYRWIQDEGLQHRILASLGPKPGAPMPISMMEDDSFFRDPEWQPVDYCDYLHLNQHVIVGTRTVQMPCLMPMGLYNRTAYSIISETGHANHTHMITEKTAKALIGRRLFVMFAGAGFLRYLREQGFRTFEGIIDESYDTVQDDLERWRLAFEQVKSLCARDQQEVLQQARFIVEHNYLHVMGQDLSCIPFHHIQRLITQYASTKIPLSTAVTGH
jgi:hypothetical protein